MNLGLAGREFDIDMLIAPLRECAERENIWRSQGHQKGNTILRHGDPVSDIFILESGLLKLVYPVDNGDEWIKSFIVDRGIFGSVDEGDAAKPSRFSAQSIEGGTYVRLPLRWAKLAISSSAELTNAYVAFSGWVRRRKEEREETLLCASAEENYRRFRTADPGLVGRLPQGDIARYLGITPVAFSRIKRRMQA